MTRGRIAIRRRTGHHRRPACSAPTSCEAVEAVVIPMKLDAHSKRLELWIKYLKTGQLGALPALPYPELLAELDIKATGLVDDRANLALRPDTITEPIRKAFEQFGLNSANPFAWRLLLYVFADSHFGPRITAAGAPRIWNDARWCELLSDFNQIKERKPKATESAICRFLKNDRTLGNRYANVSAETIRRNLQYARNPNYNKSLEMLADIYAEEELRDSGAETLEKKKALKQDALKKAFDVISTAWKRSAKIRT